MNCTEYDYSYEDTVNCYINGFILLGSLFNTLYLFVINSNINTMRRELTDLTFIKPPTYSSI
jgi:hypothetical protein